MDAISMYVTEKSPKNETAKNKTVGRPFHNMYSTATPLEHIHTIPTKN